MTVPELVLVTEKLGQNDDPGAVDTIVDGAVDGDLVGKVVVFEEGALDIRLDGELVVGLEEGDLVKDRVFPEL